MGTSAEPTTWAGRPDLSDVHGFWTAPISERAAAFAALREREPVPFFPEPDIGLPRGPGFMFRELLTRVPDIAATAPPRRLTSMFINGIKRLPVAFTPGGVR